MEILLHYVWKHRLFPLKPLQTTKNQPIEVIDSGLPNRNAGPDFFNAKLKIDGILWVGNIEIHDKASDWYLHGHDKNACYNNVILHVCSSIDTEVQTQDGRTLTQLQLDIPEHVQRHYSELLQQDIYPPCHTIIPFLSRLTIHSWMSALSTERLAQKTQAINQRLERCNGSWEYAYFVTLARNYGFGINSDAFETWALSVPINVVAHHRDNLFQVEAFFFGQAGLLNPQTIPKRYLNNALNDDYFSKLRNEYLFLAHKFGLKPMDANLWKFLRLRPQNFPYIRLSQLAHFYHENKANLSQLLSTTTLEDAKKILNSTVTPYWETHYVFGSESIRNEKHTSPFSLNLLTINTTIPILFAYGRHRGVEEYCERALRFLEQLRPENNFIMRQWQQCGLIVENAGDSQALIQLKKEYCDKKDCLRCRIGYEYLKKL